MKRRLLVLGAGGHGRVVADMALRCGYDEVAMLDDAYPAVTSSGPFSVLGPISAMTTLAEKWQYAMPAVGAGRVRLDLMARLREAGFEIPVIIDPSAVISDYTTIHPGAVIQAGSVIKIGVDIGEAAIINAGVCIGHDCKIGAGCHIAVGAMLSGDITLGESVWLGTGCSVRQGITIGADATVGIGAAVVSNLEGGRTYVGVPARPLETSPQRA